MNFSSISRYESNEAGESSPSTTLILDQDCHGMDTRYGPTRKASLQDISYDEFCSKLGSAYNPIIRDEDVSTCNGKTFSYVRRWQKNVDFKIDVGPPASPFISAEFPSSPVAVVHPSALRMSWKPNYDSVSRMAMASSPELSSYVYDVELEELLNQPTESSSSTSSDSDTISVYVPAPTPVPGCRIAPSHLQSAYALPLDNNSCCSATDGCSRANKTEDIQIRYPMASEENQVHLFIYRSQMNSHATPTNDFS